MPNDPYQISDTDSGITLVLADRGTAVAITHAASHVTGGADAIREASASPLQNGLMSTAYVTKLANIAENADVTSATGIATAVQGVATATPVNEDSIAFLDASAGNALKTATLSALGTYLGGSLVTLGSTQTIAGTKTFTQANINGGSFSGVSLSSGNQISLTANTLSGALPATNGGTGQTTYTAGDLLYSPATNTLGKLAAAATGNVLLSGTAPSWGKVSLTTHVSDVLPVTRGGTGATAATGTGNVVLASNPVLVAPNLGTPVAGSTLTYCTGLPLTTGVTGVLSIVNGGTSFSQLSYGQMSSQTAGSLIAFNTTFQKITMATTLGSPSANFSSPNGSGTLTYTGTQTRTFLVFASIDMLGDEVGDGYAIKLALDSAVIDATECRAYTAGKTGNFMAKLVTSWIVTLNTNQTLELWAASPHSDAGTPQRMRLIATPV